MLKLFDYLPELALNSTKERLASGFLIKHNYLYNNSYFYVFRQVLRNQVIAMIKVMRHLQKNY